MKHLAIGLMGALGLFLAVALAPTLPVGVPDGTDTAAAQNVPNSNASCLGLISSLLAQEQLRDEASQLVQALAGFLGVPPGRVYATVAQIGADEPICFFIYIITRSILEP